MQPSANPFPYPIPPGNLNLETQNGVYTRQVPTKSNDVVDFKIEISNRDLPDFETSVVSYVFEGIPDTDLGRLELTCKLTRDAIHQAKQLTNEEDLVISMLDGNGNAVVRNYFVSKSCLVAPYQSLSKRQKLNEFTVQFELHSYTLWQVVDK